MNVKILLSSYKNYTSGLKMLENEQRNILHELGCLDELCYLPGRGFTVELSNRKVESIVEKLILERESKEGNKVELLKKLAGIKDDMEYHIYRISLVDALMEGLGEVDRFIIHAHYIEKRTWPEVQESYAKEFETIPPTLRTLNRKAKKITENMQKKIPSM